ncbi:hypothetical protein [Thiolapillus brandeum]|nr:hypothetical protein [Thiolapillus brandeum]
MNMNKPLKLFSVTVAVTVMLSFIPQQADARKGNRGGGKARTSVNRGGGQHKAANRNKSKNINRNKNKNINRNTNVNRNHNVNIDRDIDVDVDVDHHHGCCYGGYHPVATGVAIGATAAVTSAVIGSIVYSLPPNCTTVVTNNVSYRQCGSTWYEPRYSGNDVTYVIVEAP